MFAFLSVDSPERPALSFGRLALGLALVLYFVLGLAYLALRWVIWPNLETWRPTIIAQISETLGRPVTVAGLETGFDGLQPQLLVRGLALQDGSGAAALQVPVATVVLSLRSFVTGVPRLSTLRLDSPQLTVERLAQGRWRVAGIDLPQGPDSGDSPLLDAMLAQRRLLVRDATITLVDRVDGGQQQFSGIDISVGSAGRRHRANVQVRRPGALAGPLQLMGEVYRPSGTRPADWRQWKGELYFAGQAMSSAALQRLVPALALPVNVDSADLQLWSRLEGGLPDDLLARLALRELRVQTDGAVPGLPLQLHALRAEVSAQRVRGGGYGVLVRDLALTTQDGFALRARGDQQLWLDEAGSLASGRLSVEPFDIEPALAALRALPWRNAMPALLRNAELHGLVHRLDLSFTRAARLGYDVELEFERLSLKLPPRPPPAEGQPARLGLPAVENLTGTLRASEDRGELTLFGRPAVVSFPGLFEDPRVPFAELGGQLRWQLGAHADEPWLTLFFDDLKFANGDATGNLRGSWRSASKGPGLLDIQGGLEQFNATRVARYLPLALARPVRDWVGRAITGGQGTQAKFRVKGDLYDFPFADPHKGEFRIESSVTDGALVYAPDWPVIDQINGDLVFDRASMDVAVRSARSHGVALADTRARIDDFAQTVVHVEGIGQGPAQEMVRFVNDTPVAGMTAGFTRDTRIDGQARLQLKLDLPLADLSHTRVDGAVQFAGNQVEIDQTMPALSGVTGRLEFGDAGLALRDVRAGFLGSPVRIDAGTPTPGNFQLRAHGSIDAAGIRSLIDDPLTRQLEGTTDYSCLIDVRRAVTTVTVESELAGLVSRLPAPLNKPAAARWPLKIVMAPVPEPDADKLSARDTIAVSLRQDIRLLVERLRDTTAQRMRIHRASLAVDAEPVLPERGVSVAVKSAAIDVDEWTPLLAAYQSAMQAGSAASAAAAGRPGAGGLLFTDDFSMVPTRVSLVTEHLTVAGKDLHDVVLGASRRDQVWRVNVSSREANGFINWRQPDDEQHAGVLTARFSRLEIPRSRQADIETLVESSPRDLPTVDLTADDFTLGSRHLGSLKLVARTSGTSAQPAWNLTELRIENPHGLFNASGAWAPARAGAPRSTRLDYEIDVRDAGGLLADFGLKDVVRNGTGRLTGRLTWNGSPLALDIPSLAGHIAVKVGEGQFLKTDPGIAKLIGVVNLQSLPRRLSLDFRDVFSEGFAFDDFAGDVLINRGVAQTSGLAMSGVQAKVRIQGQADIAHETQSLNVLVKPDINAGLASLAYAAAVNPVVGLGTFVAQWVLRKPLEDIFTYEYDISGSWADPVVVEKKRKPPEPSGQRSPGAAP